MALSNANVFVSQTEINVAYTTLVLEGLFIVLGRFPIFTVLFSRSDNP